MPGHLTLTRPFAGSRAPREDRTGGAARSRAGRSLLPVLLVSGRPLARYLLAAAAVGLAFLVRLALAGFFGQRVAYITFYPAVMLTATLCGLGPGLAATAASALLAWLWILPPAGQLFPLARPDAVSLVVFTGMGVFMTAVAALYHEARDRLTRAERDARVADALREQLAAEDQHRAFFENIQELVVIYQAVRDERGNVTDWVVRDTNARTREHLESLLRSMGRLPPGEPFVGLRVSAMSGPEQAALLADRWAGAIAGTPLTYERSFGGREYSVTAFAMGADVVATLAFDITDRKRAEETLRESDRRKSEFLAVLSHELRNPLVPIRNFIYVLDRAAPDSAVAARAREGIKRQTEHLTQLVDDLLDVTRISRGRIELHRSRIDLREIVRGTAEDLRSSFEEAGVALRIDQAPGPVWIEADQTRIAQVLWNLLHNALKFTPDAGIVTVDVGDDDGCAEISVRDTGVGMPPEDVRSMFEPFAQAERSLARTQGGLGLGLALVKGLVELHGGSVRARSEGPGLGAEFTVRLPLADSEGASAP